MIKGLEVFKRHFNPFINNYVLIGGAACMLAMEKIGLDFRATKDLDIVLCIEVLDVKFGEAVWDFIKAGNYQYRQQSTGKKLFYRFHSPKVSDYPQMLEFFSRKPDSITLVKNNNLTPIPIDEEVSSLSAILLDDDYYSLILAGKQDIDGLSALGPEYLIPMKVRAWLNLSALYTEGKVNQKDSRKHKNDIIRLYQLLSANIRINLPLNIKQDILKFLNELRQNPPDLKNLGFKHGNLKDIITNLSQIYCVSQ